MQQILNHLLAALVAGLLDLANARLSFGVGFVLGGLVSFCVLFVAYCQYFHVLYPRSREEKLHREILVVSWMELKRW